MSDLAPHALLNRLFDEALSDPDVGRIFVRCFQFLIEHHQFVDLYDHNRRNAMSTQAYVDAEARCDNLLSVAAERMHVASTVLGRRLLPEAIATSLRDELRTSVSGGVTPEGVFPILLAFLVSIESHLASLILSTQDTTADAEWPHLIPVTSSRPFLRVSPVAGLSEDVTAPPSGIPLQHIQLETYFGILAAPTRRGDYEPLTPVIYVPQLVPPLRECPDVLKIGLGSMFVHLYDIDWQEDHTRFWGTAVAQSKRAHIDKRLNWLLKTAVAEGVNVLVLPELNIDPELARRLERFWARERGTDLMVSVVGLTHRLESDGGGYKNAPLVFTGSGPLAWPYWKYEPVRFRFPSGFRTEALGGRPRYVSAIDTSLGRLCVLVCKDALQPSILEAVFALRASIVIVPAMTSGKSVDSFIHSARLVASANQGITIFCNSAMHVRAQTQGNSLGFVHPSIRYHAPPGHSLPNEDAQATMAVYSVPNMVRLAQGDQLSLAVHHLSQRELDADLSKRPDT